MHVARVLASSQLHLYFTTPFVFVPSADLLQRSEPASARPPTSARSQRPTSGTPNLRADRRSSDPGGPSGSNTYMILPADLDGRAMTVRPRAGNGRHHLIGARCGRQ
jgi:hypothetical protein